MTNNEIITMFETKLGYDLHKVIPLNKIDCLLDKVNKENNDNFDINNYVENICIKKYDFRRPDKFSKDQIRTLSMIHESFARLSTIGISANLRTVSQVHVSSVDQMTYEEFFRSIPNPTTIAIIDMNPLIGNAVLEIDSKLTNVIIINF